MKNTKLTPPDENSVLLDKAEVLLKTAEYAQAEKLANNVLAIEGGNDMLSGDNEARALCILGGCCIQTSRFDDALTHFGNALRAAKAASNLSLQSRALNGTATIQWKRSEHPSALHTSELALKLAEKANDQKQQSRSLNAMGIIHKRLADYPHALAYYTRSLTLAETLGDKAEVALYLGNIANVHLALADYPSSLDYSTRALDLAEAIGDKSGVAVYLGNIGNIHYHLADYSRALEYMLRALAIAEEIGENNVVAVNLGNIGNMYHALADYPRALDYMFRALALAEETDDILSVVLNLGNIGIVYKDSEEYPQALEYFKRSIDLGSSSGARGEAGYPMRGIASVERKQGDFVSAYRDFQSTLQFLRDVIKTNEGVAETLLELGGLLLEQGKTEEGLSHINESLELAVELGEKKIIALAHKEIANAYSQMGDMTKAYEHLTRHLALDKEIFSEELKKAF